MDDVTCVGSETRIEDCNHNGWGVHNCGHGEDVSISCIPSKNILFLICCLLETPSTEGLR